MGISLGFGPADLARCRFAYSPVFETLAAVRLATGPDGPGPHHRRWLDEASPRRSPGSSAAPAPRCSPRSTSRPPRRG